MPRKEDDRVRRGFEPWQEGRGARMHKVLMFIKQREKCEICEVCGHFSYQKIGNRYVSWDPETTRKYINELQDAGFVLIMDDETVVFLKKDNDKLEFT
ncbi:MAG: hypothetical protein NWE91_01925 [Candidatus Bathyarchaeota archaeon]|nr:hypothetical protein [Candidatus Bathyarchaeota archaeon]